MRQRGGTASVVIALRFYTELCQGDELPLGRHAWADTTLEGPLPMGKYVNVFTGQSLTVRSGQIRLSEALSHFPVALLVHAHHSA